VLLTYLTRDLKVVVGVDILTDAGVPCKGDSSHSPLSLPRADSLVGRIVEA
jgi:hypothetical protein